MLSAIHDQIWSRLEQAALTPADPWRTPVMVTSADSADFDACVMVLRSVKAGPGLLEGFTDARSAKVLRLKAQSAPRAAWVFYDPASRWQLRASGPVEAHTGDFLARERLRAIPQGQWQDFLGAIEPGRPLNGEETTRFLPADLQTVRQHFTVLHCRLDRLDWLELRPGHPAGHRRALWQKDSNGWIGDWVAA